MDSRLVGILHRPIRRVSTLILRECVYVDCKSAIPVPHPNLSLRFCFRLRSLCATATYKIIFEEKEEEVSAKVEIEVVEEEAVDEASVSA